MLTKEKQIAKLNGALTKLRGGKIVQNRRLNTLLGDEDYARFLDEWREQLKLRATFKNKPAVIVEYEQRLKDAVFAYEKADAASRKYRKPAKRVFDDSDVGFERLKEYLADIIAGDGDLGIWFDRPADFNFDNTPGLDPNEFPRVVTSRSRLKLSGGMTSASRTKRQVKIDATERKIAQLTEVDKPEAEAQAVVEARLAAGRRLRNRANE